MTTAINAAVVVQPSGLVIACAWCCTEQQLADLNRRYPHQVSHGLCPACITNLAQGMTS